MTRNEQDNLKINIENDVVKAAEIYDISIIISIFEKYDAQGLHDLSPCYFGEVFADLELLLNDF